MIAIRQEKARRERLRVERDAGKIRARCKSLRGFIREAWHIVEPVNPYVHGWHIDAICDHLEAITWGRFLGLGLENRLLINVPPGTMKSLIVSVFWPAWEWGPCDMAHLRYIATSFNDTVTTRDSRRMRDLVESEWFQALWNLPLKRSGATSFENVKGGWREAIVFKSLTGGRADRLLIDDPHSTETAESEAERENTTRIFRESVPTRMVDPKSSAIVVIMQRLHFNDVSGQITKLHLPYVHLMLPMEYEPSRRCETPIGFKDPRSFVDELLFPERFPRAVVDRDKKVLGSFAVAGQFQQRPTPREGGMFKKHWFEGKIVRVAPHPLIKIVRHWDLAATKKKKSPYTAGVKMGLMTTGDLLVMHVERTREEGDQVRKLIKGTAELDGYPTMISLPQDPGQAGKVQAKDYIALLIGYNARAEVESGSKETRAEPYSAQCEAGHVYLLEGPWNQDYIDELCLFPGGSYADQVDASSGAFGRLIVGVQMNNQFGAPKVILPAGLSMPVRS